ncbi:hypothetical protein [Chryseobacterium sp. WLY505]|uniref:hypothetical protein n=1 Tax=Chryseobacterium sp. WLY505 TaxID=3068892 RepID=UPI0027968142|nr:hypothetical protein [Chryseobacterium sp. WLY505]MDQ1855627.1 hypothetical protein [Chryseobacterium sp. WLY505]
MKKLDKTLTERLKQLFLQAKDEFSEEYIVVAIPNFFAKKFIAYCAMKEDLELCIEYIKLLRTETSKVIKSGLTYSLISLYGKCFTDASKNSYPKLEPNSIFKDNPEVGQNHNTLMELRHQFIAHRGETNSEIAISFLLIPKADDLEQTQVRFSQLKQMGFSQEDLDKFESLIQYILDELQKKIEKTGQKIHDGFLENFSHDLASSLILNNIKNE